VNRENGISKIGLTEGTYFFLPLAFFLAFFFDFFPELHPHVLHILRSFHIRRSISLPTGIQD